MCAASLALAFLLRQEPRVLQGPVPDWVTPAELPLAEVPGAASAPSGRQLLLWESQVDARALPPASFEHQAWRILAPRGLEQGSEVSIEFDPSYQQLAVHFVRVRRDGEALDRLDPRGWRLLQREQELEARIVDGTQTALLFLEDVRVGDVVEAAWTLTGGHPALGEHFSEGVFLGGVEPQRLVRYRLLVAPGRALRHAAVGLDLAPRVTRTPEADEYLWELADVPAVEAEDDLPAGFDPAPFLEVTTFGSWGDVRRWAEGLYALDGDSPELEAVVRELGALAADREAHALACLRFVRDEIRYLGIELGASSYVPTAPEVVLQRRFGDCKDKSLVLARMLRGLGIDAAPALVSSYAGEGLTACLPSPGAFDHMILRLVLDGRERWVDPTDPDARGRFERRAVPDPRWALVLDGRGEELTPIPRSAGVRSECRVEATYRASGDRAALLELRTTYLGRAADLVRGTIAEQSPEEHARACLDFYRAGMDGIEAQGEPVVEDDEDEDRLLVVERYRIPDFWRDEDGVRRAQVSVPELEQFLAEPGSLERSMPLACPLPGRLACDVRVALGDGWELEPRAEAIDDELLRFDFSSRNEGGRCTLHCELEGRTERVEPEDLERYAGDLARIRACTHVALEGSDRGWSARIFAILVVLAGLLLLAGLRAARRHR